MQLSSSILIYDNFQLHTHRAFEVPRRLLPSIQLHILASLGRNIRPREAKNHMADSLNACCTSWYRSRIYPHFSHELIP